MDNDLIGHILIEQGVLTPNQVARALAAQLESEAPLGRVAEQLFESARFVEGRRVLFTLLAEADRLPAADRPRVEEEARFLVARSYVQQAEALSGGPE